MLGRNQLNLQPHYLDSLQVDAAHDGALKELYSRKVPLEKTLKLQIGRFSVHRERVKCSLVQNFMDAMQMSTCGERRLRRPHPLCPRGESL